MNYRQVEIVIDESVRGLCTRPYPNHPRGCPNHARKSGCPPQSPLIGDILNLKRPVWAIWNIYDFAGHCEKMRERHPGWSKRQVECCLYWQGTARRQLYHCIAAFTDANWYQKIIRCPEAMGVNVTATMAAIGQILEWPPVTKAYQVVLAGTPKDN